jgi:hypothetical protein
LLSLFLYLQLPTVSINRRYWETHDFNPIQGRYYDVDKEERFQEQGMILREAQGSAQLAKIPPSVLYSEV